MKKPVRVIRGGDKLVSPFAPASGYRYDGLYMVVECATKRGRSGFLVCLFRFVRCPGQLPLPGVPLSMRPSTANHSTTPRSFESEFPRSESGVESSTSVTTRPMFVQGSSRPIPVPRVYEREIWSTQSECLDELEDEGGSNQEDD